MNILNPDLVERQQLTPEAVRQLETLHFIMSKLKALPIEDIPDISKYVETVEYLEFQMQRLWKFPEDASYHTHWFNDPKCSCPKLDNLDLTGIDRNVINMTCKLHGNIKRKIQ